MYFKSFQRNATIHFVIFLLIGMLSINYVIAAIWQRSIQEKSLAHIHGRITSAVRVSMLLCDEGFEGRADALKFLKRSFPDLFFSGDPTVSPSFAAVLQQAISQERGTTLSEGSYLSVFGISRRTFIAIEPLHGSCQGAVGGRVEVAGLFQQLWNRERLILVYMVVNVGVLTLLWYLRMRRLVVQPLASLVNLATTGVGAEIRTEMGLHLFQKKNAFGQLADSLKMMILKIEADKRKLEEHMEALTLANARILENQQQLVDAEKFAAVGRLAAGMAHEIGNPLGIIRGYIELLAEQGDLAPVCLDYSHRAIREVDRVDGLIRQLLNMARTREYSGSSGLQLVPVIEDVVTMFSCQMQKITIHIDSQVPKKIQVNLHEGELRQVLLNCLLNAADAIEARGEGAGTVVIGMSRDESSDPSQVKLVIEDDGIGIDDPDLANVFEPFFTTKEVGKGTGLGLAVSRSLLEQNGGRIILRQREGGVGASVTIWLPLMMEGTASESDV